MIKDALDDAKACEYRSQTLTTNAIRNWKLFRILAKREKCSDVTRLILLRVMLNNWFRMRGFHVMAKMAIRIHREQMRQYAAIPIRIWEFAWKEKLLQQKSISKASFKLWLHKNHLQRKKIEKLWQILVRATLETHIKRQKKWLKNKKQKQTKRLAKDTSPH